MARSKFSFSLEIFNLARNLEFFLIFGPSGKCSSTQSWYLYFEFTMQRVKAVTRLQFTIFWGYNTMPFPLQRCISPMHCPHGVPPCPFAAMGLPSSKHLQAEMARQESGRFAQIDSHCIFVEKEKNTFAKALAIYQHRKTPKSRKLKKNRKTIGKSYFLTIFGLFFLFFAYFSPIFWISGFFLFCRWPRLLQNYFHDVRAIRPEIASKLRSSQKKGFSSGTVK